MNNRIILFTTALLIGGYSLTATAQDEKDALRFSYLSPQGTARSMGIGGALGSIGGDFTSLSVNPAGIGVYRTSEFMFTPSLKINGVTGSYIDQSVDDNNTRFNFNNVGAVFTSAQKGRRYEKSAWKSVSFGIGINRLADFNRNYTYEGKNYSSSRAEQFVVDELNFPGSVTNFNTPAGLGFESFLIDSLGGQWYTVVPYQSGISQMRMVKERGGINEIVLSLGGNYQEKLMLGATLGIPSLRYSRESDYMEKDLTSNTNNDFDNFVYRQTLNTTGTGINLKLGFIYKPVDQFRFGVALHTPTVFGLSDESTARLTSNTENFKQLLGFNSGPITVVEQDPLIFEYSLITPWRTVLSASGILGKYGFITADYEYVGYNSARFGFDAVDADYERFVNQRIKNSYKGASNFRIGAEGRFDMVMVRLGFGYYGSPYKASISNTNRLDFSAGVGFRFGNWFTDLGFVHSQYEEDEQPYTLNYPAPTGAIAVPTATIGNSLNNVALTLGWKF